MAKASMAYELKDAPREITEKPALQAPDILPDEQQPSATKDSSHQQSEYRTRFSYDLAPRHYPEARKY